MLKKRCKTNTRPTKYNHHFKQRHFLFFILVVRGHTNAKTEWADWVRMWEIQRWTCWYSYRPNTISQFKVNWIIAENEINCSSLVGHNGESVKRIVMALSFLLNFPRVRLVNWIKFNSARIQEPIRMTGLCWMHVPRITRFVWVQTTGIESWIVSAIGLRTHQSDERILNFN